MGEAFILWAASVSVLVVGAGGSSFCQCSLQGHPSSVKVAVRASSGGKEP